MIQTEIRPSKCFSLIAAPISNHKWTRHWVRGPRIVVKQKKFKDTDYSAKDLAKDLNINTRYLSAVINSRFGENYSCLHNKYRIKEAIRLLSDKKLAHNNIEEISAMVGFSNRQSFYASFYKYMGETPNGYRKRILEEKFSKKYKIEK